MNACVSHRAYLQTHLYLCKSKLYGLTTSLTECALVSQIFVWSSTERTRAGSAWRQSAASKYVRIRGPPVHSNKDVRGEEETADVIGRDELVMVVTEAERDSGANRKGLYSLAFPFYIQHIVMLGLVTCI